ncbi:MULTISPECIES: DUF1428 domain-containing protein [unclassified Novosphingobium]|uniref:DUF1428 domain-containing protein n=1 Tax=unclassified Novosphingobium TaxID=2644732 RepID=UPI000ED14E72|nr:MULTISPECIES: DUF1428 domain-containing protein [unclassified Novosphingobium]HCF24129.1 DUF1428 domain-containing protein [Novosphingobium sp.]HQV04089.1 DUF1428 domain-containing protein [Novosphingobium sp.]
MSFFDIAIYTVASDDKQALTDFATSADQIFLEYGALRLIDGWGEDVPHGKVTDLYRAVAAGEGRTVCVGIVEWPDKATRDAGWARLETDPRMQGIQGPMDGKHMIFGGFSGLVDITA